MCYRAIVKNPIRNSEHKHPISNGAGFWETLPKPFFALAPLEDVTDAAFRRIIAQKGRLARTDGSRGGPDVTFCEFTSADGLVLADEKGQKKIRRKLLFSDIERPIVAQFFTAVPEHMEKAAAIAAAMGFDGVDINMGCPDRAVEKGRCGAAMIKEPALAREIIRAAKRGWTSGKSDSQSTGESDFQAPISVKTRLGYNEDQLEEWLPELLAEAPAAITIHARTRKEMSSVPARWDRVKRAVEIRNAIQGDSLYKTLIIGNGDLKNLEDARQKVAESGADGAMLGRAIFDNPWLFADLAHAKRGRQIERPAAISPSTDRNKICITDHFSTLAAQSRNRPSASECDAGSSSHEIAAGVAFVPTPREKVETLMEHIKLFDELLGDVRPFAVMKKHFKSYISGWDGAKELRVRLMVSAGATEAVAILRKALESP